MASVTTLGAVSILPVAWLLACSPDLRLLSDGGSFGGVDAGGEANGAGAPPSAGGSAASDNTGGDGSGDGDPLASAGEGGEAPAGGAGGGTPIGGAPPVCMPSGAETCNGNDDDCNGTVDDGCPGGVTTTFEKDLKALGDSPGGAVFADDCKHGQVLGGVHVRMHSFLAQVQGICRTVLLKPNSSAALGFGVTLNGDSPLAAHPEAGDSTLTKLTCPENEALVGLRISQQHVTLSDSSMATVIPRIWLSCAKLVLLERPDKTLGVAWDGLKELAPASGSIADGTAWFASVQAEQGLVATRLLGASGNWIDRVGFGLSRIEVTKIP
jgi:hypothetical protein